VECVSDVRTSCPLARAFAFALLKLDGNKLPEGFVLEVFQFFLVVF
jgi:hypothetical protein